jgi:hypothetical protein
MKVKNSVPLGNMVIADYLADGITLRVVTASPKAELTTIDPETMGVVSRFTFEVHPHLSSEPITDESCLYLPTKIGQILAIDKFSGQILQSMKLGNMHITSKVYQDEENIYCIGGVPLHNGKKFQLDQFAMAACDKETGTKNMQTSYFATEKVHLTVSDDLWVLSGPQISVFAKEGELKQQVDIETEPDYPLILTPKYVICLYRDGKVKIIEREDLSRLFILRASPITGTPMVAENKVFWPSANGLCILDFETKDFRLISANKQLNPSLALANSTTILGTTKDGCIIGFDLDSENFESIKLTTQLLWKPVVVDNFVFVASQEHFHHLEV